MSEQKRRKLIVVSAVLLGFVAAMSWWQLFESGPSTAKWLTAVVGTIGAVVNGVFALRGRPGPRRRLLIRRDS
jgi:hypothetical protein